MSGTNNPYDPVEAYKQWIRQNEQMQAEFQKNFERVSEQISRIPEAMKQFTPPGPAQSMDAGPQQFLDMIKRMASAWQFPKTSQYEPIFNMMLGWAAFKTNIGSNGRISIPEAERNALGIGEGDLVQVIVLPVKKKEVNQ